MPRLDLGKVVPTKGEDYFTPEDIASMEADVLAEVEEEIPTQLSELTDDSTHRLVTDTEKATWNAKAEISDIPDVSAFITKDVDNLTNYYDKTEIDSKVSAVYKYKGTVATYGDLPITGLTVGDVYNVETDGSNYAWNGTVWDKLGGDIDLSGYQTKIDSTHKLSSDLVDDTNNTNKFVTSAEKTTWNGKQNALTAGTGITIQNDVISSTGGDVSGKEDKANKVTILNSSSTDTQYPSAKAVYDDCGLKSDYYIFYTDLNDANEKQKIIADLQKIIKNLADDPSDLRKFMTITYDMNGYKVRLTAEIVNFYSSNSFYTFREDARRMWNYGDTTGDRTIRVAYSEGVITDIRVFNNNIDNYYRTLSVSNTTTYTPTSDYNPATKKYVDDQVGNISTVLSSLTTVSGGE